MQESNHYTFQNLPSHPSSPCTFVCLFVIKSIHPSIYLSNSLLIYLSIYISNCIYPSIYLFASLSVCLSLSCPLSIRPLSIYLSIYLSPDAEQCGRVGESLRDARVCSESYNSKSATT
jgi:hypothetical protein